MSALLLIVAIGIGYLVWRGRKRPLEMEIKEQAQAPGQPQDIFPSPAALGTLPKYSAGATFHHKGTGEKVEVLQAPEIVNGEYKIRWPDGGIGYIHQSSFKEFFE